MSHSGETSSTGLQSKLSIRWILPLAVVAPVFAVSLVLILLAYHTGRQTANELASQSISQIHKQIENHLNHLMELPAAINRLNRTRLENGILSLNDPDRSSKLVFETLQTFPDISSIVLGSSSGQVMWVIRYPGETSYEYAIKSTPQGSMQEFSMGSDGRINPTLLRSYAFDALNRPWYRAAVEAGGPTWGNVYVWIRGGKAVTLGVPYVEPFQDARGAIAGVINCELTLSDISAFLRRLRVGKTGMAFIMERDGNLVATSTDMECMKEGTGRLAAVEASDPRIVAAAKQLTSDAGSLAAIDSIRSGHIEFNGTPAQMVVSHFKNRRNLDWLIVTLVPDSDFLAGVQRSRAQSMLIGAAAIFAALGIGAAVALWLLRPILAVVSHARRVGEGDLDAHMERHDNKEISQLSHALNEMARGLQDRMKLRHALDLAMEVQQNLLPQQTPKIAGLDIAARSKYCDETGGDYYDYLSVEGMGPNSLLIALGDVTGHGIAAAMLMATARGVLRAQVRTHGSLGHLLTQVNEHLVIDTNGTRFMTMLLALVDMESKSMRWASAGHDEPLLYDSQSGQMVPIDASETGFPLGVTSGEEYREFTHAPLRPGQVMLIGTDGLWEAMNSNEELFGKKRVADALAQLAHLPAAEIEAGMFERVKKFCGDRAIHDDVTYVVIKFTG